MANWYNKSNMNEVFARNATNELTEHVVYHKLALMEKNPGNRAALERLSAQEKTHYEFWQSLLPASEAQRIRARWFTVWGLWFLRATLGVTFMTKFLETHESGAVEKYEGIMSSIPESHKTRFLQVIEDEKSHERALIGQLKEKRVAYMGFIVLGLADAIVEITGVHAGFLGVTGSTLIAGVAGVIVGFSAAISMGSASYLQAKQDTEKSALLSGFLTWISYFCSVILLALPYFLIRMMLPAFITSTSVGILLVAGFTFYGAIVFDRKFWREFAETVGLMLATALATYLLGVIVGTIFHINPASF
jgi:VIT1/CCC1 family predicted Fe2+/Mn2+ transporter